LGEAADSSWSMERILAAVLALLNHLEQVGQTTVLLFDDIQWMDPASAELLGAVTGALAKGRLAVACAGRPGEFADNEPARMLVRTWNREGLLERLVLGPLKDQEAAALARAHAGSTDVKDAVASCGGNPLYLIESVRSGANPSPEGVVSLVADRFAVLDEPTRDIVDWAALMGRAFPAARLGALLDRSLDELLRQTETLERHGILIPHGNEWDFAHDLFRRTALGLISGPRRALMHRRTARLMSDEPDPSGTLLGELVFHAAHGDLPEIAVKAAVDAGDRALKLAAFDDAWRVAERGLHEAGKLAGPASIETSVELLRVQVLAGLGRRDSLEMFTRLTGLSRRAAAEGLTPTVRTARWLLSVVAEEAGEFDQARAHSLKAEEATREADPETRLKAVANTARCLLQLERDQDKAAELLDQARQLSEDLDQPVLDIPWGTGLLHLMNGQPNEARTALEQGVEMAAAQDNHWAHFECLSRLSMLDLSVGNGAAVLRRDVPLRAVAEKLGEGSELALAGVLLALAGRQMGNPPGDLESALEALREADSKGLLSYALVEAGQIEFIYGNLEKAAASAEEAAEAAGQVGRHHQLRRAMKLFERIDKMMK
jgi:tetratricopeptide (TPR) repeat protein